MSLRPDVTGVGISAPPPPPVIGGFHVFGFMGLWVSHADTSVIPPEPPLTRMGDSRTRAKEPVDFGYYQWKYGRVKPDQALEADQDLETLEHFIDEAEQARIESENRHGRILAKLEQKRLAADIDAAKAERLELDAELAVLRDNIVQAKEAIELVRLTKRRQAMATAAILATLELLF